MFFLKMPEKIDLSLPENDNFLENMIDVQEDESRLNLQRNGVKSTVSIEIKNNNRFFSTSHK